MSGSARLILPVVLGLLFTCVLGPVARWLGGRGLPPAAAAGLAVLALLIALVGVVWLTIDAVVDQWSEIESLIEVGRNTLAETVEDTGISTDAVETLDDATSDAVGSIVDLLFRGALQILPTVVGLITAVVLSLLVAFFFVKDGASMWRWIIARFDTAGPRSSTG